MSTPNDTRWTPSEALGTPRERGELILVGQVAMATDHGGRRTMPTDDAGSLTGGRSSETREEVLTGAWTVRLLHGALREVDGTDEEREWGARFCSQTTGQTTKQSTTSCSTTQRRVDLAFSLVHPRHVKLF